MTITVYLTTWFVDRFLSSNANMHITKRVKYMPEKFGKKGQRVQTMNLKFETTGGQVLIAGTLRRSGRITYGGGK